MKTSASLALALPELKPGDFEEAKQTSSSSRANRATPIDRVKAFKVLDVAARHGKPLDVEVQVIALGDDLAWVALPGEFSSSSAWTLRSARRSRHTVIVELANGSVGYVPTKRAFAEGNYEPTNARIARGSGEMLAEAAVKLLNEFHDPINRPSSTQSSCSSMLHSFAAQDIAPLLAIIPA